MLSLPDSWPRVGVVPLVVGLLLQRHVWSLRGGSADCFGFPHFDDGVTFPSLYGDTIPTLP